MAGDKFKKVQSGDKLQISAETFNTLIDAGRDFKARQHNRQRQQQLGVRQNGIFPIRNNSGADRNRFDVLGIDSPIISPTDNLDEFKNRISTVGVTPQLTAHQGRFAVLLEPVADGEIAQAVLAGVTVARVTVTSQTESYDCAEVDDGKPDALKLDECGSAQVLWKETGSGTKWALIRLGNHCCHGFTGNKQAVVDIICDPYDPYGCPTAVIETWTFQCGRLISTE